MRQSSKTLKAIPQTTLRRLRNTPSYFFLLWRWVSWLFALIWIVSIQGRPNLPLATLLLVITFLQTLVVTLYAPIFKIFLPTFPGIKNMRQPGQLVVAEQRKFWQLRRRPLAADEEGDILTPLARTRNPNWDIAIYSLDVVICGMVTYFGGYFGIPHFGSSSPFYRYGISTALAAALSYRYRGGLAAALGYDLFILLGAFFPPPGTIPYPLLARDLAGSLLDAPVIAILAAYLASLLQSYTRSRRREQDNVRLQKALRHVSETLVTGARDRQSLLQYSAEQMRKGGHFERLLLGLVRAKSEDDVSNAQRFELDICVEAGFVDPSWPDKSRSFMEQVMQTGETYSDFEHLRTETNEDSYGMSRLYLPIFLDGQLYLIIGVESTRRTPFESKQEEFLNTTGPQLVVALENMRLTEQTAELAAEAERGRIARDIHDGVAQLVYMLSLNTETCAALAHRIAEASEDEEDKEVLDPLAQRLDTLVTISKQALWETRNYMFTLKPLISGTSTLTQMLTNQVREFETISGLPVRLEVVGSEEDIHNNGNQSHNGNTHTTALVGTAIFRITQEALTNAYKHAEATQLHVQLRHLPQAIEVEICDNGKGLMTSGLTIREPGSNLTLPGEQPRIYSGHGMRGMRERATELGGTFEITTMPDGGVSVKARLPK
ncbi:MAG: GAF domain-containing sensor histidine kinase [Ktedonobacteraceae bacterium]